MEIEQLPLRSWVDNFICSGARAMLCVVAYVGRFACLARHDRSGAACMVCLTCSGPILVQRRFVFLEKYIYIYTFCLCCSEHVYTDRAISASLHEWDQIHACAREPGRSKLSHLCIFRMLAGFFRGYTDLGRSRHVGMLNLGSAAKEFWRLGFL